VNISRFVALLVAASMSFQPLLAEAQPAPPAGITSAAVQVRAAKRPSRLRRLKSWSWHQYERMAQGSKRVFSRRLYRPLLNGFRATMTHSGELFRKYLSGRDMDANGFRWGVVEGLFKKGKFKGSFGHVVHPGSVEITSPVIQDINAVDAIRSQTYRVAHYARRLPWAKTSGPVVSAMPSISGMSFPQLSASSVLALTYMHLKMAKSGIPQLFNTGEGGPRFHLALLAGDAVALKAEVLQWGHKTGALVEGSHAEAKVAVFIEKLMAGRKKLFAEFSPADLDKAQIVAQFGTALNGIRGENYRIDWGKLKKVGRNPRVAMVQFKLKQAAKRGAHLDKSKVDPITAAMREISPADTSVSPPINPEMSSPEAIANLVKKARRTTGKPVSLKFGVGEVESTYRLLAYLKEHNALPDHIQLDGRGKGFSPGSGNAPPAGSTSLPINEATIVVNALLTKLGVRNRVFLEATGDVLLPGDGVEKLALGADGIGAARLYMGMGLGCAKVKLCAAGGCPYGIASRSGSVFAMSLDPAVIGPQGYRAAASWYADFATKIAETGAPDWRQFRNTNGLQQQDNQVRKADDRGTVKLRSYYSPERVYDLLDGAMSRPEIDRIVFGKTTAGTQLSSVGTQLSAR
jgi:glutamate synthase domain-containing protein 2